MICDIFIRTYKKDIEWLDYCVRSIKKYCSSYRNLVIVYPEGEQECGKFSLTSFAASPINPDGYIDQQYSKLIADTYCKQDATHLLMLDSDCFAHDYISPKTYIRNDKILFPITHKTSPQVSECQPFIKTCESILNCEVEYEFMRRQPFLLQTKDLKSFREWFDQTQSVDLKSYLSNCKKADSFSEYNLIGAYLYYIKKSDDYHFYDTDSGTCFYNPMLQSWSYGGLTEDILNRYNTYLNTAKARGGSH